MWASQNLQGLTGTPLVAGSPIRHDNTVQGNPVEVQTYQPPWKALSEFALQSDLEQPAFQQLVRDVTYTSCKLHHAKTSQLQPLIPLFLAIYITAIFI